MPRKSRRVPLTIYHVPDIDPKDRNAVEDHHIVQHALVDIDELAVLSRDIKEQLVAALVHALGFFRAGIKLGKRGVSDKAVAKQIFLSDVRNGLERAGLPAKRWRKKYDNGGGESLFFRLARALAKVAGIVLPQDLKLTGKRATGIEYQKISPATIICRQRDLTQEDHP